MKHTCQYYHTYWMILASMPIRWSWLQCLTFSSVERSRIIRCRCALKIIKALLKRLGAFGARLNLIDLLFLGMMASPLLSLCLSLLWLFVVGDDVMNQFVGESKAERWFANGVCGKDEGSTSINKRSGDKWEEFAFEPYIWGETWRAHALPPCYRNNIGTAKKQKYPKFHKKEKINNFESIQYFLLWILKTLCTKWLNKLFRQNT